MNPPLEYEISASRASDAEGRASCKHAALKFDTAPGGRDDAFNPAELFLTSLAGCILKSIERVSPMLRFEFQSVDIRVHGVRQDKPPRMTHVSYEIRIDTDEPDHRLDLLHENVRKFGTIFNTVATACTLEGRIVRMKTQ